MGSERTCPLPIKSVEWTGTNGLDNFTTPTRAGRARSRAEGSLCSIGWHRAVATVNMDAAAVNIVMTLVLRSRSPSFGSGHQAQRQRRHAAFAKLTVTV